MRKRILTILLTALCSALWSETLNNEITSLVQEAVFEVVVPKAQTDQLVYEEELPLDLLPYSERTAKYSSIGTAFRIENNRFVTAAHVLNLEDRAKLPEIYLRTPSGDLFELDQIYHYSDHRDFAVFTIENPPEGRYLQLSDSVGLNQPVYTIGNALGEGVIIREGLLTSMTPEQENGDWQWLRFSAAASPGNSGGPLVNSDGEVLGIVSRKSQNENLNFALPMSELLSVPENTARLEKKIIYTLPHLTTRDISYMEQDFPLPLHYRDLREELYRYYDRFIQDQFNRLVTDNRETTFPHTDNAKNLLFGLYRIFFPGIIGEKEDYNWTIFSPKETNTSKISETTALEYGSMYGYDMFYLETIDNVLYRDLFEDSKLLLDTILDGYVYSRKIQNISIRINSFGDPIDTFTHVDSYNRTWRGAVFPIDFADSELLLFSLPTPSGYVSFVKIYNYAHQSGYKMDLTEIVESFYLSFSGDVDQWKTYLELEQHRPDSLESFSITEDDSDLEIRYDGFPIQYNKDLYHINSDSILTLSMVYRESGDAILWEPAEIILDSNNDINDYLILRRTYKPDPDLPEDFQTIWNELANREGHMDGVPYTYDGWSYVSHVIEDISTENLIYSCYYGKEGEINDQIAARADGILNQFRTSTETDSEQSDIELAAATDPSPAESDSTSETTRKSKEKTAPADLPESSEQTTSEMPETTSAENLADDSDQPEQTEIAVELPPEPQPDEESEEIREEDTENEDVPQAQITQALQPEDDNQEDETDGSVVTDDPFLVLTSGRRNDYLTYIEFPSRLTHQDTQGRTPLFYAIQYGDEKLIKELIYLGSDVNTTDINGATPLLLALEYSTSEICHFLLQKGAIPVGQSSGGETPLTLAVKGHSLHLTEALIRNGAAVDPANRQDSPLLLLVQQEKMEGALFLLNSGADPNIINEEGTTPLHAAIQVGNRLLAKELISAGADPSITDADGLTPEELARQLGMTPMLGLFSSILSE